MTPHPLFSRKPPATHHRNLRCTACAELVAVLEAPRMFLLAESYTCGECLVRGLRGRPRLEAV